MLHTMDVVTGAGTPFRAVYIPAVDAGPNPYRHPGDNREATVEFYDRRHHDTDRAGDGQFTGASYYVSSLTGGSDVTGPGAARLIASGLNLHGGVPAWFIDGPTIADVLAWLQTMSIRERMGVI